MKCIEKDVHRLMRWVRITKCFFTYGESGFESQSILLNHGFESSQPPKRASVSVKTVTVVAFKMYRWIIDNNAKLHRVLFTFIALFLFVSSPHILWPFWTTVWKLKHVFLYLPTNRRLCDIFDHTSNMTEFKRYLWNPFEWWTIPKSRKVFVCKWREKRPEKRNIQINISSEK